jgi:prepilin-type N-terminal cleavage/methylation domain-containing protein
MRRLFTLVELIAVLLIIGIVGAVATVGLGAATRGFSQGEIRTDRAQKTQIAMQRLIMELRFVMRDATSGDLLLTVSDDGHRIDFATRRDGTVHVFQLTSSELRLDGKVLMDHVSEFDASYSAASGELAFSLTVDDLGTFESAVYP